MADVLNSNVFDANKKFVDLASLDYFWDKAKGYIDGVDEELSGKVGTLETTVGNADSGLVKEVAALRSEMNALGNVEGGDGIVGMIDAKIAELDLPNTYEAKGEAAKAEAAAKKYADDLAVNYDAAGSAEAAKAYADSLDSEMNKRVEVLEAIDHTKLAEDASAAAVATILDGAPEKFDTLKEVAQWIADSETAADAADLVTRVAALEEIDHEAYKAADAKVLEDAQAYVDGKVDGKFDATGAAAAAEAAAKKYADDTFQVKGDYEAAGTADAKIAALKLADTYEAKGAAATAQAAAIAQAKLDAAEALKGYYTKGEVDNLLTTNSTGDRAYAKQYTDELFNSIKFATNSDIDTLFA
jgi:hypothetical protein